MATREAFQGSHLHYLQSIFACYRSTILQKEHFCKSVDNRAQQQATMMPGRWTLNRNVTMQALLYLYCNTVHLSIKIISLCMFWHLSSTASTAKTHAHKYNIQTHGALKVEGNANELFPFGLEKDLWYSLDCLMYSRVKGNVCCDIKDVLIGDGKAHTIQYNSMFLLHPGLCHVVIWDSTWFVVR